MAALQASNVIVPDRMKLERLLRMKGGNEETSYANNSQAQALHARSMLHVLIRELDGIVLPYPTSEFKVADLGCSSSNNTLFIVEFIIKHLTKRYQGLGWETPEFQVFFSDLPSNDFNTLFQLLPPLQFRNMISLEECLAYDGGSSGGSTARSYYAAGVPGSFYGRLFPAASINVFHSAFSLHWLSQVPEVVIDAKSPAYNEGRIYIHGASEYTSNAYRQQFQADLATFLRCRARELKAGGSMFLVFLGRTSHDPSDQGGAGLLFGTHFQDAWNDLVHEGCIEAGKRDSFNVPVYAASLEEVKEVVEADGGFEMKALEMFRGGSPLVVSRPEEPAEVGRALANSCRTVCGVLVEAHLGEELSDELFDRLQRRGAAHAAHVLEHLQFYHIVASLTIR